MSRRVFFSFNYKADNWRVSQVRNIGAVQGNKAVSDNDWEAVSKRGDKAIKNWIDGQLKGRSCTIVLVGAKTAGRKWINYEIERSWNMGKGVVGIRIHNLLDRRGRPSKEGKNPFQGISTPDGKLSDLVELHNPFVFPIFGTSKGAYDSIKNNIFEWVEEAVSIRAEH